MAESEELVPESALTIKQMSAFTGLSEYTLRYYEKIGLIEPIARDGSSGHRRYSRETAAVVEVLCCLRASGLSVKDMRTYLRLRQLGDKGAKEQKALFEAHARRVAKDIRQLKIRQQYLANKVAYWEARDQGNADEAALIVQANQKLARKLK